MNSQEYKEMQYQLNQLRAKLAIAKKLHEKNKLAVAESRANVWRYRHAIDAMDEVQ
jgi:hypothetical protein